MTDPLVITFLIAAGLMLLTGNTIAGAAFLICAWASLPTTRGGSRR